MLGRSSGGALMYRRILGHSSIKMTYDLYGYLFRSDDEDQAAMAQIEARLLGS
jgi:integrase